LDNKIKENENIQSEKAKKAPFPISPSRIIRIAGAILSGATILTPNNRSRPLTGQWKRRKEEVS